MIIRTFKKEDAPIILAWIKNKTDLRKWSADRYRDYPATPDEMAQLYAPDNMTSLTAEDENGNITEIHCTYDPATKGGDSTDGRKVKGTIHWVYAGEAVPVTVRLYENIIDEEKGVYNEDGSLNLNPHSLQVCNALVEPALKNAEPFERFQFVRNGYFCVDSKDSRPGAPVFNRIVGLKSSFKLPKA